MQQPIGRPRERYERNFTLTSNALLIGYPYVSDGAKVTYQVIDSMDWPDEKGRRKGFAYPKVATLAALRGMSHKTIRRHINELERAGLIQTAMRPGRSSVLIIQNPSIHANSLDTFVQTRGDNNVQGQLEEDKMEERRILVNDHETTSVLDTGVVQRPEHIGETLGRMRLSSRTNLDDATESKTRQEYFAKELARELNDDSSLAFYRTVTRTVPTQHIYELLGEVKQAKTDLQIRNAGAYFTALLRKRGLIADPHERGSQNG